MKLAGQTIGLDLSSDHEGVGGMPRAIPMNERLLVAAALSKAPRLWVCSAPITAAQSCGAAPRKRTSRPPTSLAVWKAAIWSQTTPAFISLSRLDRRRRPRTVGDRGFWPIGTHVTGATKRATASSVSTTTVRPNRICHDAHSYHFANSSITQVWCGNHCTVVGPITVPDF